jgi:RNA polymerase sigma-70 factor, ECF subfamily
VVGLVSLRLHPGRATAESGLMSVEGVQPAYAPWIVLKGRPHQPATTAAPENAVEADLVTRACSDPHAFGELYEQHVPQIYRFVYGRLRDREAAQDLTADIFFKALRAIDRYRPAGPPFAAWLFRIAANAVTDYTRPRRSTASLDELVDRADGQISVEDEVVSRAQAAQVWAAIDTLRDAQRTALALRLGQDMHTADIAAVMGRSEGAVKLLIHRGLAAIRCQLAGNEGVDQ